MYRISVWIITHNLSFFLLLALQVVKVRSFILMFNVSAGIAVHNCSNIFYILKHYCFIFNEITVLIHNNPQGLNYLWVFFFCCCGTQIVTDYNPFHKNKDNLYLSLTVVINASNDWQCWWLEFPLFQILVYCNKSVKIGGQTAPSNRKGPHIQRHSCTAYSPKMNSCLVVWSCRTMRRISGKWALGWHCTHTLWRGGGISTLERI